MTAMYKQRNGVAGLLLPIATIVTFIRTAESQPEVLSNPYEENTWYSLRCESGQRWHCSGDRLWEVQPDGVGPFQRVELGTEFVEAIPTVPGDLDILLNNITMGVYRCSCRREGGQMLELRTIAYFFSKGQRFRRSPPDSTITVLKGDPLNISVYYPEFLPEAAGLVTMTLVEEASGDSWPAFLRNHTADFSVENPKPGSYHLVVTTRDHGNLNSTSFNVTIKDQPPPEPPQQPTGGLDAAGWVIALIVIAIVVAVAALYCALPSVIFGGLKWRMARRRIVVIQADGGADDEALADGGHDDLHHEDDVGNRVQVEVVHENPHHEDDVSNRVQVEVVHENPHHEDDVGNRPLLAADEPRHYEPDAGGHLPLGVADESPHHEPAAGSHLPLGVADGNPHREDDVTHLQLANGENPHREDDVTHPPLANDEYPHHEDDVTHPPLTNDETPHHEDDAGTGDRLPLPDVDENPHREDDGSNLPLLSVATVLLHDAVPQARYVAAPLLDPDSTHATDKSLKSPHEEECLDHVYRNQQIAQQCTDHNGRYRNVDEVHRLASSRSSVNSAERERLMRSCWVQPSSSRSETEQPSVTADGFGVQSAVENVPKPFN